MKPSAADIIRDYGPFPGIDHVHGLTFDGKQVWFAAGGSIEALPPPGLPRGMKARMDAVPSVGQHSLAILAELGFSKEEVEALTATRAVAGPSTSSSPV